MSLLPFVSDSDCEHSRLGYPRCLWSAALSTKSPSGLPFVIQRAPCHSSQVADLPHKGATSDFGQQDICAIGGEEPGGLPDLGAEHRIGVYLPAGLSATGLAGERPNCTRMPGASGICHWGHPVGGSGVVFNSCSSPPVLVTLTYKCTVH